MEQEFSQFSEFRESDKPLKHEEIAGLNPFTIMTNIFVLEL